jgi:hypothetical protein
VNYDSIVEKKLVFPAGQKIGTIFCPKGGLAVHKLTDFKGYKGKLH